MLIEDLIINSTSTALTLEEHPDIDAMTRNAAIPVLRQRNTLNARDDELREKMDYNEDHRDDRCSVELRTRIGGCESI